MCKACQLKGRAQGSTSIYKEKAVTKGKVKFIAKEEVCRIMLRDSFKYRCKQVKSSQASKI